MGKLPKHIERKRNLSSRRLFGKMVWNRKAHFYSFPKRRLYHGGILLKRIREYQSLFLFCFQRNTFISKLFKGDYRVIDTDYKNYALVYSCSDFYFAKVFTAYILSRTPELPEEYLEKALRNLEENFEMRREEMKFDIQRESYCGKHWINF